MAFPKMSLKLLVDQKSQRVLFAEASKDFVDFLFHVFSLPLGTLIELVGSEHMVGCFGKFKDSIESFNGTYLQHDIDRDDILNLTSAFNENSNFLLPCNDKPVTSSKMLYGCSSFHNDEQEDVRAYFEEEEEDESDEEYDIDRSCEKCVTDHFDALCPSCSSLMNVPLNFVAASNKTSAIQDGKKEKKSSKGYVKEAVTYMVMDNLVVKPISTISTISFIKNIGVKDLSQLEEKMVTLENAEALKLLKASLITDKVLTTVFL